MEKLTRLSLKPKLRQSISEKNTQLTNTIKCNTVFIHFTMIIKKLIWEEWNIAHISRHNILPGEVEEICQTSSHTENAEKGRIRITGLTKEERLISAFLDPETDDGIYYPVSARDASKKERRSYKAWNKGGEK